jgi:hypothetical protein
MSSRNCNSCSTDIEPRFDLGIGYLPTKKAPYNISGDQRSWDMNPSATTEQKIVKTTHNPESETPEANDDGGGDRRNHGDYMGVTDSSDE